MILILVPSAVLYEVSLRITGKSAFRVVGLMAKLAEQERIHNQIGTYSRAQTYSKELECAGSSARLSDLKSMGSISQMSWDTDDIWSIPTISKLEKVKLKAKWIKVN